MRLNRLSAGDKNTFDGYLGKARHELSVYSFSNIYIWKKLFDIRWLIFKDSLCIFFRDSLGSFLYLPPLADRAKPQVIREVFEIMGDTNRNKDISRIENVEEEDLDFYRGTGYECVHKSYDYVCRRRDLANLAGNKFKSKRACFNYFIKRYKFKYLPFSLRHKGACLKLYELWMRQRKTKNGDPIYQGMLGDSLSSFKILLANYRDLGLLGRIVKVNEEIKAFSFGFRLNCDTFCILYEITDLSIKGLAQFIFRSFCSELKSYRYINIMDDSGLQNLKEVKLSYHPVKLIPAYIVKEKR